MNIALMIPTISRADLLREAIVPLLANRDVFGRFIVIDNGQQDLAFLEGGPVIHRPPSNLGFGRSCNWAIENMLLGGDGADWLMVHSDDIVLSDCTVRNLPKLCELHKDAWLVRSKASFAVFLLSRAGALAMEYEPGRYFDHVFWPGQFEDVDLEWRMELIAPERIVRREPDLMPAVWHRQSSKGAIEDWHGYRQKNREYFLRKWGSIRPKNRYRVPFNGEKPWP